MHSSVQVVHWERLTNVHVVDELADIAETNDDVLSNAVKGSFFHFVAGTEYFTRCRDVVPMPGGGVGLTHRIRVKIAILTQRGNHM